MSITEADFNKKAFPNKPPLLLCSASLAITSAESSVPDFLVATLSMNFVF
jgi:hypothetical protein